MQQQPGEDVVSYYDRMCILFEKMKPSPDEKTILSKIFEGMQPHIRKYDGIKDPWWAKGCPSRRNLKAEKVINPIGK